MSFALNPLLPSQRTSQYITVNEVCTLQLRAVNKLTSKLVRFSLHAIDVLRVTADVCRSTTYRRHRRLGQPPPAPLLLQIHPFSFMLIGFEDLQIELSSWHCARKNKCAAGEALRPPLGLGMAGSIDPIVPLWHTGGDYERTTRGRTAAVTGAASDGNKSRYE